MLGLTLLKQESTTQFEELGGGGCLAAWSRKANVPRDAWHSGDQSARRSPAKVGNGRPPGHRGTPYSVFTGS